MKNLNDLVEKYPELYGEHPYFCCENGWYEILDTLSAQLTQLAKDDKIEIEVAQVKEKFGTLRFYVYGATEKAYEYIEAAEVKSQTVCEYCGAKALNGARGVPNWLKTLCEECHEKALG